MSNEGKTLFLIGAHELISRSMRFTSLNGKDCEAPPFPRQELALVYRRSEARQPSSETAKQARLIASSRRMELTFSNLSANTRVGTFETSNIGIAKVKNALNKPWNASSGRRATLNRL